MTLYKKISYIGIILLFLSYNQLLAQESTEIVSDTTTNEDHTPTISLEDAEVGDENTSISGQGVSSVLNAGRDVFNNAAVFNFSITRFRIRGYDNDHFTTYMNGVPTEYIDNGFQAFNIWAGLNDVLRNRENYLGLKPTTFTFGALGGAYNIDSRASKQRKQTQITLGSGNRTYDLRAGITYGSGLTSKGWAVAASLFGRYAKQGYVNGTGLKSMSYFLSVEKITKNHSIALTTFGAPTKQGKTSPVIQEMYDFDGTNYYNPNWGYQNGKVRSAREENRHQPMMILTHEWKIAPNKNLTTAASYSFGERMLSRIDRYKAWDPRPDYYKYLPSYADNAETAQIITDYINANPNVLQIQWDKLYAFNSEQEAETINNVDGILGNSITGKRGHFVFGDEVEKHNRFNFNTVYNVSAGNKADITVGATYQYQNTRKFKRIRDLLGADFFIDVDEFVEEDSLGTNLFAGVNDLNHPYKALQVGDTYQYDYDVVNHKTNLWGQIVHHYDHVDLMMAAEVSNTTQWRVGNFKNGMNPNNSEGKSETISNFNYALKGGITYKINGRNYLYVNGIIETRAPYWSRQFLSPRTSNDKNIDISSEFIRSIEGGYILNSPKARLKASMYYTSFKNGSNSIFFYDDVINAFGNYTIIGIDKTHYGGELSAEVDIYKGLSASVVASVGNFFYSSRQTGIVTVDNDPNYKYEETIYSDNFKVGGAPQQAYTLGLYYKSPKYWYVSANVNFFDQFYTEVSPTHRTDRAVDAVPYQSENWYNILRQERRSPKGEYTVDLSGGYSWKLSNTFNGIKNRNSYLVLNTGIANLTNNNNITVSAREQLRYDYDLKDPNKFPTKYAYAYGLNFYVNLIYRF
jgi:hypothetical protein